MTYEEIMVNNNYPISEEEKGYIYMATLNIEGMTIIMQDLLKSMQYEYNTNVTISIGIKDVSRIKEWFDGMKEGGKITCELQEMPWSKCYGALKDKFGISWQFMYDEN
jgi:PhnB protein